MKNFLIISLLATLLFAKNPNVYSALGDDVYNSAQKIQELKDKPEFAYLNEKINKFVKDAKEVKSHGFAIESGDKSADKNVYLKELRELSKVNDYFKRTIYKSFKSSIKNKNNALFSAVINSGLVDINSNKNEILDYYHKNSDTIEASEVIQGLLDQESAVKKRQKSYKSAKKERELDKIKRLRKNDKLQEERKIKELEAEIKEMKKKIREYQQKELSGS